MIELTADLTNWKPMAEIQSFDEGILNNAPLDSFAPKCFFRVRDLGLILKP